MEQGLGVEVNYTLWLHVLSCPVIWHSYFSPDTNPEVAPVAILQINYQDFDVEQNVTILGWNFTSTSGCGDNVTFLLQGYTLQSLLNRMSLDLPSPIINHAIHGSLTAQIPADELTTVEDSIVYRVVALDKDGNICSDPTSQQLFYQFDGAYVGYTST